MADKPSLVERIRAQQERHRARSRVIRVPVAVVGFGLLLVGVALLVLPGPGWLVIALGLALLALEFAWAERILERVVDRLEAASERAARAGRLEKALAVAASIVFAGALVAAVLLLDLPGPF
ncbi:MAG: PGPGW domain-containing protein [Gaiellaceae bacterium]